jgi:ABC-2 type transport system permease protein
VNAFRYGILGVSDIDIAAGFLIILGSIAILFVVSLRLLNKGVGLRQ